MGETQKRIRKYVPKTHEELRQLAVDIVSGLVFTSAHFRDDVELENLLQMVFMPLIFMSKEDIEELRANDIHIIYEYYSKAGPRGINGKPIFMSCGMLDRKDARKVWAMMKDFSEKTQDFLDQRSAMPTLDPNQMELFSDDETATHD